MKLNILALALASTMMFGTTAFATETGGGNSASAGASATAGAGANASVDAGDLLSLGAASIGGAPGVKSTVIGPIGWSKPARCYEVAMLIEMNARLGHPYSARSVDSMIAQACNVKARSAAPAPLMVQSDDYVGGGKGAVVTRTSTMNAAPTASVEPSSSTIQFLRPSVNGKASVFKVNGKTKTLKINPSTVVEGMRINIGGKSYTVAG